MFFKYKSYVHKDAGTLLPVQKILAPESGIHWSSCAEMLARLEPEELCRVDG